MRLRLLFLAFADVEHGLGHFYRTEAAMSAARARGHAVALASNVDGGRFYLETTNDCIALTDIINDFRPDWLVADILAEPPLWLAGLVHGCSARLALLNGVGRTEREARADLLWTQDTPEKAILRPEVLKLRRKHARTDKWFVWGGAADVLGLLPKFVRACPDWRAWLVTTSLAQQYEEPTNPGQLLLPTVGDEIYSPMSDCGKAVLHLGMTCWELAALGVPMYLFSRSTGHLRDAKRFEALGLAKAWPRVGLPSDKAFYQFLSEPLVPTGKQPDGKGAQRFVEQLERA